MREPYYADDLVTLWHGDCREVTEWLAADVLVTDPPYGRDYRGSSQGWTNAAGGGGHRSTGQATSIANDKDTTARDAALALWGDRRAIVFGDPLIELPAGAVQALVYQKPFDAGIRGARVGFRRDVEMIYLCGPWPVGIGGSSSILGTSGYVAGPRGIATRAGHPHAKPQDVMQRLTWLGDGTIADPFAGSGSTLIAAKHHGRKAIGVEIDEAYCEIAARRLAQDVLDFTEEPA